MWPFRNISLDKKQREKAGLFSQHFASGTKRRERHIPVGAYNLYLIFEDPYSSLKKSISHSTKVCNIHVYNHILSTLNNNIQYIAAREVYPFMI